MYSAIDWPVVVWAAEVGALWLGIVANLDVPAPIGSPTLLGVIRGIALCHPDTVLFWLWILRHGLSMGSPGNIFWFAVASHCITILRLAWELTFSSKSDYPISPSPLSLVIHGLTLPFRPLLIMPYQFVFYRLVFPLLFPSKTLQALRMPYSKNHSNVLTVYKILGESKKTEGKRGGGGGKRPVAVFIHGGAWWGGNAWFISLMGHIPDLLSKGYIVVIPEYTRGLRVWPNQLVNCREALKFTHDFVPTIGGDRSRIIVMGVSAGGHLSAMLSLEKKTRRLITGAVLMYPAIDLFMTDIPFTVSFGFSLSILRIRKGQGLLEWFWENIIIGPSKITPRSVKEACPRHLLTQISKEDIQEVPPILLITGSGDSVCAAEAGRIFVNELKAKRKVGVIKRDGYVEFPRLEHSFDSHSGVLTMSNARIIRRWIEEVFTGHAGEEGKD
ncbi:hypothetical protein AAMO2058_000742800 [Amorphochlora amoebiformis]